MLTRVHRLVASRVAAVLVAVALSGLGRAAAELPRSGGAHICQCPKGDHDCTCPVCSAVAAAARARDPSSPEPHRPQHPASDEEKSSRCCVKSACHVPEALVQADGREVFTLVRAVAVACIAWQECVSPIVTSPRDGRRRPDVPPPRTAARS